MGAMLVVIVAILLSLYAAFMPSEVASNARIGVANSTSAQSLAGNLIAFHDAAVSFVSNTANRNPSSTTWSFSANSQATVRCSSSYTGGTYAGTCPDNELKIPSFLPRTAGVNNVVDWNVYYKDSTTDIIVTYATSTTNVAGYTPTQIAMALSDYQLSAQYTNWYWGVVTTNSLSNGNSSITMPTGYTGGNGVVAIATVIP